MPPPKHTAGRHPVGPCQVPSRTTCCSARNPPANPPPPVAPAPLPPRSRPAPAPLSFSFPPDARRAPALRPRASAPAPALPRPPPLPPDLSPGGDMRGTCGWQAVLALWHSGPEHCGRGCHKATRCDLVCLRAKTEVALCAPGPKRSGPVCLSPCLLLQSVVIRVLLTSYGHSDLSLCGCFPGYASAGVTSFARFF